jgi:uncharacterized membrane protein
MFWILHDLGDLLINTLEWKVFFMWVLCCPEVGWVTKIWGVMFLMVPPKDKFVVWHVLKHFWYGWITSYMFTFHTYLNYIMGWKYVVHVHAELWIVGLCRVPHSNQDTQTSIKSYHEVLKHWFSLETKGLRGCHIN